MLSLLIQTNANNIFGDGRKYTIQDLSLSVAIDAEISIETDEFVLVYETNIDISNGYSANTELVKLGGNIINGNLLLKDVINARLSTTRVYVLRVTCSIEALSATNPVLIKYLKVKAI